MSTIFVVEDDDALRRELCALLELEGFRSQTCTSFSHAAQEALAANPDCIILDAMLPGIDGRVVARDIRHESDVPLIMLTCLDSEYDEVTAMNQGADDFLTKPYRPAVLMAHLRAALRRHGKAERTVLTHRGISLDIGSGRVSCDGRGTELTRNETRILALLMRNAGTVITRQEIMCELWDSDTFVDDNTLTVNVNRLRKELAGIGAPDDFIITRRGEGYRV